MRFKVGDKVVMTKGDHVGAKGVVVDVFRGATDFSGQGSSVGYWCISVKFGKPLEAYGTGPMQHMIESYGLELIDKPDTSDWADVWESGSE